MVSRKPECVFHHRQKSEEKSVAQSELQTSLGPRRNDGSLGKKRKICARTIPELERWAKLKEIQFRPCKDCKPYEHLSEVIPEAEYNAMLEKLRKQIQSRSADDTLIADIEKVSKRTTDPTSKKTLIDARVGQGKFRTEVLKLWNYRCAVTGSSTEKAIRASHIKPWWASTDSERLDPKNGLLLVANLDALFDAGLVSFEDSGKMIVSSELSQTEREIFGTFGKKLCKPPAIETANYLAYHRNEVFHD